MHVSSPSEEQIYVVDFCNMCRIALTLLGIIKVLKEIYSQIIKNGLGVAEMVYLSLQSKVSYIHQQHILTTPFHENIFFCGNEVLIS